MSNNSTKTLQDRLRQDLLPGLKRIGFWVLRPVLALPGILARGIRGVFGFVIGLFSGVTAVVVPILLFVVGLTFGYFVDLSKIGTLANSQFENLAQTTTSQPTATPTEEAAPTPPPATPTPSNREPDLTIDAQGLSRATVELRTSQGIVKFKFYPKDAPRTVNRMLDLIQQGFYTNLKFHRVVPGFVVQGGDPQGDGTGGSGMKISSEFNSRKHVEGAVALARGADPDSGDSQFYICLGRFPHLDGKYTIFGQVIYGMDVVRKLHIGDQILEMRVE